MHDMSQPASLQPLVSCYSTHTQMRLTPRLMQVLASLEQLQPALPSALGSNTNGVRPPGAVSTLL